MVPEARGNNQISAAAVNAALRHTSLRESLVYLPEVGSTNTLALEAAQAGARTGVWVADAQTAGRGRGGHLWHSAPGDGLYVSALFTPHLPASTPTLSLAAGLAAWQAIRDVSGLTVDIRWPNDLVTRADRSPHATSRKLGGVLVESAVEPARAGAVAALRYAVVGIGLNVAHAAFPENLQIEATSLRLEGWVTPERQSLLIALLQRLDANIRHLEDAAAGLATGPGVVAQLAEASTWLTGKRVSVPEAGGYTGTTAGLDPQGFLQVDSDDGVRRTVRSGGVRALE